MKKILSFIILIIILLTSTLILAGFTDKNPPPLDLDREREILLQKSNQVIVKFKEGEGKSFSKGLDKGYKSQGIASSYDIDKDTKVITVEDSDLDGFIQRIKSDPSVEMAEKNYKYKLYSPPNDTYYSELWHLDKINAEKAWAQTSFDREVMVAVIDSGVDYNHRDLKDRLADGGYNFLYGNTDIYDYYGHGTFISGLIAGKTNNNYGISGVSGDLNVKILPLLVTDSEGVANSTDIIQAIDYCISRKVDVINLSLGGPDYSFFFDEAVQRAIDANIVVVAAIGNEGLETNQINFPAAFHRVIAVGSLDRNDQKSDFSNANDYLDLVAPGRDIYSIWPMDNFIYGGGTSYAAPMVAAAAALMKGIEKDLNPEDAAYILYSTAKDLGPAGKDIFYGHGRLDIEGAIKSLKRGQGSNDFKDFEITNVRNDKVLRIEFNHSVFRDSLNDGVYASLDRYGTKKDLNILISQDRDNPKIIYLSPKVAWQRGRNYIFIDNRVKDLRGKSHKEKVRIIVNVID